MLINVVSSFELAQICNVKRRIIKSISLFDSKESGADVFLIFKTMDVVLFNYFIYINGPRFVIY